MGFKTNKISKSNFRAMITRKQAQFNRFAKRYASAKTMTEKRFLKTEGARICKELKQCCKMWKKCGFGSFKWINRSCKMSCFTTKKTSSRRTRKTYARRTNVRRFAKRRFSKRSYARRAFRTNNRRNSMKTRRFGWNVRKNRSNKARRSYVAW